MADLAAEFHARGCPVTLLTARWEESWPARLELYRVPVVRLPQPRRRVWGTARYMFALRQWLRRERQHYDLVYVSMLKHDAYAALCAVGRRAPVVLRAEGAGQTGDVAWQHSGLIGRMIRRRTRRAAALVAPSPHIAEELRGAGYPSARIREIPNGVPIAAPLDNPQRRAARDALSLAHTALYVPPGSPLAVYTGRLHPGKGLEDLLVAWSKVLALWPEGRLWLAGNGPLRGVLAAQINRLGLAGSVVLAGVFQQVDELLAAADLFVLPSYEEGMSLALLEAMAAGLPIVATDIAGNRVLVEHGCQGLLVPPGQPESLAAAMLRILDEPIVAEGLGQAARQKVIDRFSLERCVDQHLELFRELLQTPAN
jgi:glycosyltransferase involved in cell wall biosynthesis